MPTRAKRVATPSKAQLKRIYDGLRRKPNVVACFLGLKYSKGRRRQTPAIVCLVLRKKSRRTLPRRSRIPPVVYWRGKDGEQREIPTDVVTVRSGSRLCSTSFGPGDRCAILGPGSLGFGMSHPELGDVLTTAGHSALRENEPAGNYDFRSSPRPAILRRGGKGQAQSGQALFASCTTVNDYALVRPDSPNLCTNFHRSGVRIKPPPEQEPALGVSVTLFTSTGASKKATLIGIHGQAPIGKAGRMVDVILTTPTLIGGDSGGLLAISQSREALGLAVGFVPVSKKRIISVFMPAETVLDQEGGTFL